MEFWVRRVVVVVVTVVATIRVLEGVNQIILSRTCAEGFLRHGGEAEMGGGKGLGFSLCAAPLPSTRVLISEADETEGLVDGLASYRGREGC